MPHDKNGKAINAGDIVSLKLKVISVQAVQDYCNLTAETVEGMPPSGSKSTISLNTKQVEVIDKAAQGD